MLTLRPVRWAEDAALLADLDTSFTTERVYRVLRNELGFTLVRARVDPPLRKDYGAITHASRVRQMDCAIVAEHQGRPAGFAAADYVSWNRRVVVWHLYVAPERRRTGVGAALLDGLDAFARSAGARCLWVETQNTNFPAVQFYQRMGFRLCGLDESLYDSARTGPHETALFFVRDVVPAEALTADGVGADTS
jgi:ribosomal protein S18 acetylase RimI-like enzyme